MYQKDYILRMLEMIAQLIEALLGLIHKGEIKKASKTLEMAYYDFLKKDASFFRKIELERLTDELLEEHNYTNSHLKILSELFYAEAELKSAESNYSTSLEFYEKSLILKEFTLKGSSSFSLGEQSRINMLKQKIAAVKNSISS